MRRTSCSAPSRILVAQVERVLHGAGGVVLLEVQRVEVEPRRLDLGALGHLPAHADEHVGDALGELRERVAGAARAPVPRQRDVDRLLDEHALVALLHQGGVPGVERLLGLLARGVHPLARVGALRARQRPELAAGEQQRGAVAEVRGLGGGQRGEVGRAREGLPGRGDGGGQRVGVQKVHDVRLTHQGRDRMAPGSRRSRRGIPRRPWRGSGSRPGRGSAPARGGRLASATVAGTPCASPPNIQATGPASTGATAGSCRSSSPCASATSVVSPAARQAAERGARCRARARSGGGTASRWTPARPCRCAGRPCRPRAPRRRPPPRRPPARPCPRCRDRPPPTHTATSCGAPASARVERHVEQVADGEDALRRDGVGEARRGPLGDHTTRRRAEQVGVPRRGGFGDEQLAHPPVPQRLPHGLGALDEEPPRPVAPRAAQQLASCDDARGTLRAGRFDLRGQAADSFSGESFSADSFAGRFALATSTSAANAASSVTAMSASTLRSTSTPAALRPWTKRL